MRIVIILSLVLPILMRSITEGRRQRKSSKTEGIYNQVTSSLAGPYDTLYYIDVETGTYAELSSTDEYKKLNVPGNRKGFLCRKQKKYT